MRPKCYSPALSDGNAVQWATHLQRYQHRRCCSLSSTESTLAGESEPAATAAWSLRHRLLFASTEFKWESCPCLLSVCYRRFDYLQLQHLLHSLPFFDFKRHSEAVYNVTITTTNSFDSTCFLLQSLYWLFAWSMSNSSNLARHLYCPASGCGAPAGCSCIEACEAVSWQYHLNFDCTRPLWASIMLYI